MRMTTPAARLLGALLFTVPLAGCFSRTDRKVTDLAPFHRIYVEHQLVDDHRIDEMIVRELQHLGHEASAGPRTMLPDDADAVLTYDARWEWDFKTYLIELTIEMHTARSNKKLADGRYYQPSLKTKSPPEVVHELLTPLFTAK